MPKFYDENLALGIVLKQLSNGGQRQSLIKTCLTTPIVDYEVMSLWDRRLFTLILCCEKLTWIWKDKIWICVRHSMNHNIGNITLKSPGTWQMWQPSNHVCSPSNMVHVDCLTASPHQRGTDTGSDWSETCIVDFSEFLS